MQNLLELHNLTVRYGQVDALTGVSFSLRRGEIVVIVGESGSGKSTLINAILNILPVDARVCADRMLYAGIDLQQLDQSGWRELYGNEIGVIFQNPLTALNPLLRIRTQFIETIRANSTKDRQDALAIAESMLRKMQLANPQEVLDSYPFQLSGGMLQRVLIAMALSLAPSLIIADEPTSALDAFTKKAIIQEFLHLKDRHGIGVLFITHDLRIASHIADRILVMSNGSIVEQGPKDEVLGVGTHSFHPG